MAAGIRNANGEEILLMKIGQFFALMGPAQASLINFDYEKEGSKSHLKQHGGPMQKTEKGPIY